MNPAFLFVGGKGGVGKTTCAAAMALRSAATRPTLLVSTDPASSLGDALHVPVSHAARAVGRARNLHVVDIDARSAFRAWLAPRRDLLASIALRGTYLDGDDVARLLKLSLPGIDEAVALLEVVRLAGTGYARVVVDTAPTGHTLRLLSMPSLFSAVARVLDTLQAHHREVVHALTRRYVADACDRLIAELGAHAVDLAALLRDPARTSVVWITLPEPMALEETADAIAALSATGIRVRTLVVNRRTPDGGCVWDAARRRFENRALAPVTSAFPDLDFRALPDWPDEPRGLQTLRRLADACGPLKSASRPAPPRTRQYADVRAGSTLPALPLPFAVRWLLFGGKGGVGKTTCSAAVAVQLAAARPRDRFLLLSSDPAHSLGDVLGARVRDEAAPVPHAPVNLDVREIDAAAGLRRFRERYVASVDAAFAQLARGGLAAAADRAAFRQLLDLAPPGIDEMLAIAEASDLIAADGPYATVVSDTAPTGHALRLLEMPELLRDWTQALMAILLKYRDIVGAGALAELLVQLSKRLRLLQSRLRDANETAFVLVTRPAVLPREESMRFAASLHRLQIPVRAMIVNAFGAGSCARCAAQVRRQTRELRAIAQGPARRGAYAIIVAPAALPPPHGPLALHDWTCRWRRMES